MKTFFLLLIATVLSINVSAQRTVIWKGGKPGRANDWNCAANWSTYQVPDEFCDVIIPKMEPPFYPQIRSGNAEVNSIRITCGATLTIGPQAGLLILNPDFCDDVSRIVAFGKLELPGYLSAEQKSDVVNRDQKP